MNDSGPGEWSPSTVACFQDDEKDCSGDEETCSSTQELPNNDVASPRQLQVAEVTASIGGMSISSKSPPENPASVVTTPSLQAQTYPGATVSVPLVSPVPVEQLPIPTTLTQHNQMSTQLPVTFQYDSLHPVPQSTDSPLPNALAPVPNVPLPNTSNSVQADAIVSVAPNPGTSVLPSTLAPRAPENLRISTKRTETLIKLRWQPSSTYSEAAACYELEMHPMMSFKVCWKIVATTHKLSAKVTHLQPDTSYEFRVRAMNAEGTPGPYSETITGSTKASKSAGSGTGAVSRSAYSGLSKLAASGSSLFGSSKLKGKNPSGVGEYVFGGLSRGIKNAGDYLGSKAKVEEEPVSPQSSDDEQ